MDSNLLRYMELWHRLDKVVADLTQRGELQTADYLAVGFFLEFPDVVGLERFVEIAEQIPNEL